MQIELSAGSISYRDVGDRNAPVLVFVHGLLVAGDVWDDVVDALPNHRCIVPDWPLGSHRIAMKPDAALHPDAIAALVAEFIAALDLRDVTLVGNDSGGALSQLVVARHNAERRITRLVLTTCDAFEVFPPKLFAYLGITAHVPGAWWLLGKTMRAIPALTRLPIAYGIVTKHGLDRDLVARWVEPAATNAGVRRDLTKFVRGVRPAVTLEVATELPDVDLPVLLVWTPEDRCFPFSLGERLQKTFADAKLVAIDDAFVFVQKDQPKKLAKEIMSFVRSAWRKTERATEACS